jgi:hypothetical protein
MYALAIIILCILVITAIIIRSGENFTDYPTYTSGASMRIGEARVSDISGQWRTKFGEDEGKWYARYYARDSQEAQQIKNPTYRTAVTF